LALLLIPRRIASAAASYSSKNISTTTSIARTGPSLCGLPRAHLDCGRYCCPAVCVLRASLATCHISRRILTHHSQRFVLPRLADSYAKRQALVAHQRGLIEHLAESSKALKDAQQTHFSGLPRRNPYDEDTKFASSTTLTSLKDAASGNITSAPNLSIARCTILEYTEKHRHGPTSQEWLEHLSGAQPDLLGDEERRLALIDVLTHAPCFHQDVQEGQEPRWIYTPPTPPDAPAIVTQLNELKTELLPPSTPEGTEIGKGRYKGMLQALVDLTGYLTAQTYSFGTYGRPAYGAGDARLSPAAEEVRREIRALKGLALNR
jgi:hypothetical protein